MISNVNISFCTLCNIFIKVRKRIAVSFALCGVNFLVLICIHTPLSCARALCRIHHILASNVKNTVQTMYSLYWVNFIYTGTYRNVPNAFFQTWYRHVCTTPMTSTFLILWGIPVRFDYACIHYYTSHAQYMCIGSGINREKNTVHSQR